MHCLCQAAIKHNGWGCGECGRACYVFVPRRKRPSGRNRSEVPMSTHIGYTPCCMLALSYLICILKSKVQLLFLLSVILNSKGTTVFEVALGETVNLTAYEL